MNQELWNEFCDRLKQAGTLINDVSAPQDPLTQAEGYRYLTRLLRAGLESCVEGSDPRFPTFYSLSHDTIKIGNDNPDNYYLNCCVSGEYDYVINGEVGEVEYFSVATKAGSYATTGDMQPTGEISSSELNFNEDGSFTILVSTTQPTDTSLYPNWLPMARNSDNLIVRQYCNARRERPAQFRIQCLNAATANTLDPERFAELLLRSVGFVEGTSGLFSNWINQFKQHSNQLPANDQQMCIKVGGNEKIHYHNSHWRLAEDEVLVIEPEGIPECEAWNFQLSNYWMESLDYRYHQVTCNNQSTHTNEAGKIVIAVSHLPNPTPSERYPNWLSTAGHSEGGMLFRWIEATSFPPVNTRVVKLSELT